MRPLPGTEEYIKVFTVSLLRTIIQICHTEMSSSTTAKEKCMMKDNKRRKPGREIVQ